MSDQDNMARRLAGMEARWKQANDNQKATISRLVEDRQILLRYVTQSLEGLIPGGTHHRILLDIQQVLNGTSKAADLRKKIRRT